MCSKIIIEYGVLGLSNTFVKILSMHVNDEDVTGVGLVTSGYKP